MNPCRRLHLGRAAAGALLLAGCHGAAGPAPSPASVSPSPFRQPNETVSLPQDAVQAIYTAVLQFYRPAGGQVRWLDLRLLPATPHDTAATLDQALASRLIQGLGSARYCLDEAASRCTGLPGGRLRLSPVYGLTADEARVVVDFQGIGRPYAPETAYSGTQVFLLQRQTDAWNIRVHVPAGS